MFGIILFMEHGFTEIEINSVGEQFQQQIIHRTVLVS